MNSLLYISPSVSLINIWNNRQSQFATDEHFASSTVDVHHLNVVLSSFFLFILRQMLCVIGAKA